MKKIFFLLLALITFHFTSIAQCPQASAQVLTTHHGEIYESGAYNSFGVRITLNQVNSEDVTVTGVVFETENQSISANFSITVNAGYLTAEADDLLTAGRDSYAAVTINSVSPCPNYQYDYLGQYHNDALDYALVNLQLPIASGNDIIDVVQGYFNSINSGFSASAFFSSYTQLATEFENASDICNIFNQYGLSAQFCTYYNSINSTLDNASSAESFNSSMLSLETEIAQSTISLIEKQILLSSAAVYRYSANYWSSSEKTNAWNEKLSMPIAYISFKENLSGFSKIIITPEPPIATPFYEKFFFSWKSLAKADGKGAIEGGVAGAIVGGSVSFGTLTVPGWVVGAVGWGAGCSVSNVIGQLFSWW